MLPLPHLPPARTEAGVFLGAAAATEGGARGKMEGGGEGGEAQ